MQGFFVVVVKEYPLTHETQYGGRSFKTLQAISVCGKISSVST